MQGSGPGPGGPPPRRKGLKSRGPGQAPIGCRSLPGPIAGEGGDVTARGGQPQGGAPLRTHLCTRSPASRPSRPPRVPSDRGRPGPRCCAGPLQPRV